MGKKVKCVNCQNCTRFAIPNKKYLESSSWTETVVRERIICEYTMKEKWDSNEQQCKHYIEADDFHKMMNSREHQESEINNVLNS